MNILVCVKRVPLTGGKMVLTDDARAISTKHLGFTVSPHEECGAEEAVRIVERLGGESVVLTLGPPEAEEQLRDMMAIGVVDAIGADGTPFDLILFGNESADAGNYQVAIRVAYKLGLPVVTGVKAISVDDGGVRLEQEVAGGRDIYELSTPAVVTVKEGLNLPRYPSVPGRLRAKKKPVAASTPARPQPQLEMVRLVLPPGAGKETEVLGNGADAAPAVVSVLDELGLL